MAARPVPEFSEMVAGDAGEVRVERLALYSDNDSTGGKPPEWCWAPRRAVPKRRPARDAATELVAELVTVSTPSSSGRGAGRLFLLSKAKAPPFKVPKRLTGRTSSTRKRAVAPPPQWHPLADGLEL